MNVKEILPFDKWGSIVHLARPASLQMDKRLSSSEHSTELIHWTYKC